MMKRRRDLLYIPVQQGGNDTPAYITNMLTTHPLSVASNSAATAVWYYGGDYTFDVSTGVFTLTSPTMITISYTTARTYRTRSIFGKYCILNASSGSTMYLMPSTATITVAVASGVYSSYINGDITEFVVPV